MSNALINKPVTMSSLEIAELTGKRHDNVRRDIENMASELSLSFEEKVIPTVGARSRSTCWSAARLRSC
ncbi:Rha family transcriptional regulator [Stutzerimonas stutzeri]|uniref:Rha family transcriptional regulator n=1 Tax=Stutzerimonas stutzeri TaxID=316 RepID=UPI0024497E57|nr:Rha family transcriptional regulator [Stutzerimonas stutzeri]MDH0444859.1 Rha family transcriptional regulator [Stutzerimonas stutzeri]